MKRKKPKDLPLKMDPNKLSRAVSALAKLVSQLRGPGGCPWDAEQTDSTIKIYLLEEAYEVLEAVEKSSPGDVCLELGDLLFQILFLARIAEERGEFDLVDVVEGITEKMIRRHPHVFGKTRVDNSDQVATNWEKIKREEKGFSKSEASRLKDVPSDLPALLRSHRLGERASKIGLDLEDEDNLWRNAKEKFNELEGSLVTEEMEAFGRHFGDLLLVLTNVAREQGFNPENLLREANQRFINRIESMEKFLRETGVEIEKATREQKSQAWKKAEDETEKDRFGAEKEKGNS
ncbi:nucleoside triphosphate pyrophosphohydrolase [Thermodesulfobacteriota bacterium]